MKQRLHQSMLRRSVIQMLQHQDVPDKQCFLPFVNERDGIGRLLSSSKLQVPARLPVHQRIPPPSGGSPEPGKREVASLPNIRRSSVGLNGSRQCSGLYVERLKEVSGKFIPVVKRRLLIKAKCLATNVAH